MAGELFGPIFVPDRFSEAVSGRAWLWAMLEAEGALAVAQARAGLIPRRQQRPSSPAATLPASIPRR